MYYQYPPPGHHDTLAHRKKEIESNTFWKGWIRTGGKRQILTATTTSSGLHFGSSCTQWKPYKVYFYMDLESYPYDLRGCRDPQFTTETLSFHGAASPDFGPMGCVSSGAQ